MSEASKTPVTDANICIKYEMVGGGYGREEAFEYVEAEIARSLETQLTAARADSERLAAVLEKVESANNGIGDAWEALARIETISTEALSAHKALDQKENEL